MTREELLSHIAVLCGRHIDDLNQAIDLLDLQMPLKPTSLTSSVRTSARLFQSLFLSTRHNQANVQNEYILRLSNSYDRLHRLGKNYPIEGVEIDRITSSILPEVIHNIQSNADESTLAWLAARDQFEAWFGFSTEGRNDFVAWTRNNEFMQHILRLVHQACQQLTPQSKKILYSHAIVMAKFQCAQMARYYNQGCIDSKEMSDCTQFVEAMVQCVQDIIYPRPKVASESFAGGGWIMIIPGMFIAIPAVFMAMAASAYVAIISCAIAILTGLTAVVTGYARTPNYSTSVSTRDTQLVLRRPSEASSEQGSEAPRATASSDNSFRPSGP